MSNSAAKISSTASSEASIFATRSAIVTVALALDQAGDVKPRGIERLQDVMARRRDEPRLRHVGVIGFRLRALELGIEPGEFAGALAHAALQRRIGALQRFGRLHARRDVGKGRDQAAVRHAVRTHFDHQAAFGEAFEERLGFATIFGDALGDKFVDASGVALAMLGDVAQDILERDADAGQFVRQIENFAELPVPADQRQLLVEHGDALPHVIERGLQDFAVVVDRGIGVVEKLQRRLGRDRAFAQDERQHEPRRRRADRRGEQIFGVLQELEIGLGRRRKIDAPGRREAGEGFAGTLFAEIARHRGDQFLDRRGSTAQTKARRDRSSATTARTNPPAPARSPSDGGRASSRSGRRR